jgi:hypothetical protein
MAYGPLDEWLTWRLWAVMHVANVHGLGLAVSSLATVVQLGLGRHAFGYRDPLGPFCLWLFRYMVGPLDLWLYRDFIGTVVHMANVRCMGR